MLHSDSEILYANELKRKSIEISERTGIDISCVWEFLESKKYGLDDLHSFVQCFGELPDQDADSFIENWGVGFLISQAHIFKHRFSRIENKKAP